MAINATNNGIQRELIPAGNYIARCYLMVHIGTVEETIMGTKKMLNKVRIGWELPTEKRTFKPEDGEQPCVVSKEYTLSMNEKANLRKMLASWRGKDFTDKEAESFDVTKLIGVPCMLNLIHKPSKTDPTRIYEEIGSVSPMPKEFTCPEQINKTVKLEYDNFNQDTFNSLPDWIKQKVQQSEEYASLRQPNATHIPDPRDITVPIDDLPF